METKFTILEYKFGNKNTNGLQCKPSFCIYWSRFGAFTVLTGEYFLDGSPLLKISVLQSECLCCCRKNSSD